MKTRKLIGILIDLLLLSTGGLVGMPFGIPFWKGFIIGFFVIGIYSLSDIIVLHIKNKLEK